MFLNLFAHMKQIISIINSEISEATTGFAFIITGTNLQEKGETWLGKCRFRDSH